MEKFQPFFLNFQNLHLFRNKRSSHSFKQPLLVDFLNQFTVFKIRNKLTERQHCRHYQPQVYQKVNR